MSDSFSPRRSASFSSSGRKPFSAKHYTAYGKPAHSHSRPYPHAYTKPSRDDIIDRFLPPRYHSPR